jgi:Skp family chaperone for outer membrane proteins
MVQTDRGSIMKASLTLCLAVFLAGASSAMAQTQTPSEPAAAPAAASTTAATTPAPAESAQPAKPKKQKTAKKNTKTAKTGAARHASSGARIYKENGKTCSGEDQYKVCW